MKSTGFTPGDLSEINRVPMRRCRMGRKPGYEDRKAELEAKLAE